MESIFCNFDLLLSLQSQLRSRIMIRLHVDPPVAFLFSTPVLCFTLKKQNPDFGWLLCA